MPAHTLDGRQEVETLLHFIFLHSAALGAVCLRSLLGAVQAIDEALCLGSALDALERHLDGVIQLAIQLLLNGKARYVNQEASAMLWVFMMATPILT